MADDDWRVTATVQDEAHVRRVVQALHEHQVTDDVRHRLGNRIAVSADGPDIFLYAATEVAAREAEQVVRAALARHQLGADFALARWHPVEEEWEDAGAPLPETAAQRQAEHDRLMAEETQQSLASGSALWEVRVDVRSHREAVDLAKRLRAEGYPHLQSRGYPVIRRWKFLVLGADNEEAAGGLAEAIKRDVPADASVQTEAGLFVDFGNAHRGDYPLFPH